MSIRRPVENHHDYIPGPVRHYVDRRSLDDKLWSAFLAEGTRVSGSATVLVLQGLGGTGKSQLALHWAKQHMSESSTHGQLWLLLCIVVVLWKRISGLQGPLLPSQLLPRIAPIAYIS